MLTVLLLPTKIAPAPPVAALEVMVAAVTAAVLPTAALPLLMVEELPNCTVKVAPLPAIVPELFSTLFAEPKAVPITSGALTVAPEATVTVAPVAAVFE